MEWRAFVNRRRLLPGLMASLLILTLLFVLPALFTWGLVRLLLAHDIRTTRRSLLALAVPAGAILPLLPGTVWLAMTDTINNPVPIAIAGTLILAAGVGLLVCLPVGLAATRDI